MAFIFVECERGAAFMRPPLQPLLCLAQSTELLREAMAFQRGALTTTQTKLSGAQVLRKLLLRRAMAFIFAECERGVHDPPQCRTGLRRTTLYIDDLHLPLRCRDTRRGRAKAMKAHCGASTAPIAGCRSVGHRLHQQTYRRIAGSQVQLPRRRIAGSQVQLPHSLPAQQSVQKRTHVAAISS